MYPESYRSRVASSDLISFHVTVKETDLHVSAVKNLRSKTLRLVQKFRNQLEEYIARHPDFRTSLVPLPPTEDSPVIARAMADAGAKAGVGPMAAVAGAIAEFVGKELLPFSADLIIENGGDIFLSSHTARVVGIYAGSSPLSRLLGIEINPGETPLGVCTSSGTVGHSLSLGKADAVVMLAPSAILADAAATAVGNTVKTTNDIPAGLEQARKIDGVTGVLIIKGDKMGTWGKVKLCRTKTN
jgi:uncharacterized protein